MGSLNFFFQFTQSFRPHSGPGIDSAPNRNEYHGSSCVEGKVWPARKDVVFTAACEPIFPDRF
jgi:hypothetical protein